MCIDLDGNKWPLEVTPAEAWNPGSDCIELDCVSHRLLRAYEYSSDPTQPLISCQRNLCIEPVQRKKSAGLERTGKSDMDASDADVVVCLVQ